ncbi:hypothetical protein MHSWG343_02500 [Candidatus Mycoplasma haematohominis]|uniref:Uncharacterized protein n=1 Tax=Candidatus Mycoplasma haematohominis TaxID=1494318 RepID=A0A478FQQ1_9MOLU|nr:hypothetical protein MHSWG343_02500 [Candidatus Mycoplasma haemohominis]
MFKSLKLPSSVNLKNPYLFGVPLTALTGSSAYSIYKNVDFVPHIEHHYLARVQLTKNDGSSSSSDIQELVKEDRGRLINYYKRYDSKYSSVNTSDDYTDDKATFFLHVRDKSTAPNLNNLWLNNVSLNQLSIDRYGYEYDESGNKKTDSNSAKLTKLVEWKNIDLSNFAYKTIKETTIPSISFNIKENILKDQVSILMNEEEGKYKIEESEKDASNDWFVWLDKDLLTLKLNYALQTYVFNQSGAHVESTVKSIVGESSSRNNDQSIKWESIQNNLKELPEGYEQFAKDYISSFVDTSATNGKPSNWSTVVNKVTSTDQFIKTDELNQIYNRFQKTSKAITLFKPHVVTKITSGKTGNWKVVLDLEKKEEEKKEEEKKLEDDKKQETKYEARDIKKLETSTTNDEKEKNKINLIFDVSTDTTVKFDELFNRVSKYSVKNFKFDDTVKTVSAVYSASDSDRAKEALRILDIQHENEYGIYKQEKWLPSILSVVFLLGIIAYLTTSFKKPGAIFSAGVVVSAVNVAGVFFALGSKLSLVGLFASFIGVFYALFLSLFALSFLKKIFSIEFLDRSNVWVVFKRGIVTATDVSLPLFVFSTFIAFLAPLHLREFGIVLSLFVLISYLCVSVMSCLMALKYANSKFASIADKYQSEEVSSDVLLRVCNRGFGNCKLLTGIGSSLAVVLLVATVLFFTVGFNSFSFLKDNSLITFDLGSWSLGSGKTMDTAKGVLSDSAIAQQLQSYQQFGIGSGTTKSFLIHGSNWAGLKNLLSSNLAAGTYYMQSTDMFSDIQTTKDLFKAVGFAGALIAIYLFIRFGFKNTLIFLLNNLISFALFVSLLLVTRIVVSSSIFLVVCSFFAVSTIYHVLLFSLDSHTKSTWYLPLLGDIRNILYTKMRFSILWFICCLSLSALAGFWMISIYVGLSVVIVHLLVTFVYFFLSDRFEFIRDRYMWKRESLNTVVSYDNTGAARLSEEEESLDPYDEEIILGVNKSC